MNKTQSGFTLIELVMVIVILGILAAVAVPRFVDLSVNAQDAAEDAAAGGVKSGHAVAVARFERLPTVTELGAQVDGGAAVATGIDVTIDGSSFIVLTFTDAGCTAATSAVGDTVSCIQ